MLILTDVVHCTLFYTPVWQEALECESNRTKVNLNYRSVVQAMCRRAFRTLAGGTTCVIESDVTCESEALLAEQCLAGFEERSRNWWWFSWIRISHTALRS